MSISYIFNPFTGNLDAITDPIAFPGSPNTFAGFDVSGNLVSLTNWLWNPAPQFNNGLNVGQNTDPAPNPGGPNYYSINNISTNFNPSVTVPNQNPTCLNLTSTISSNANSADMGQWQGLAINSGYNGSGVLAGATAFNVNFVNGDGSSVGSLGNSNIFNLSFQNSSGQTIAAGVQLINAAGYLNSGSIVSGNVNLLNMSLNANAPITGGNGVNYANFGSQCSSSMQYLNGVVVNPQFLTGASVVNNINGFAVNGNVQTGASVGGWTAFSAFENIDSGSTFNGGYTGLAIGPNLNGSLAGFGFNGVSIGAQFASTMNYLNCFNTFSNLNSGTNIANGVQAFGDGTNVQSGATVNYMSSYSAFPFFHSGSTLVGQYQGINVAPGFDIVAPSITLAQFNVNGSGSSPQITGVNIDVSNLASPNQKAALQVGGGASSMYSPYDTSILTPAGAFQLNGLGGELTIAAGFPISGAFGFGDNVGTQIIAHDDMVADNFLGSSSLGFSEVGFVGQVYVDSGKTFDTLNFMAAGASVFTGSAGAMNYVSFYRVLGLVPGGGALTIANMYGLKVEPTFTAMSPTNAWGVWVGDTNAHNWLAKDLVIGGSTGLPTNASVALEIQGTTSTFRNAVLTTTERNALTPLQGMQIWNSTTNQEEAYDGSAWVAVGGNADPLDGELFNNLSAGNRTVATAQCLFYPFLTIDTPDTYTLQTGSQLLTYSTMTVNGTLLVQGTAVVKFLM